MESEVFSVSAAFLKTEGTECFAPYVYLSLSAITGREQPVPVKFKARVDTGADITCVPRKLAAPLMPLPLGRSVLTRGHHGSVQRTRTYMVIVSLFGHPNGDQVWSCRPARGVLLTDSDIALLGMDILANLDLRVCAGRLELKEKWLAAW